MKIKLGILFAVLVVLLITIANKHGVFDGFDYTKHSIPVDEIEKGGPNKDAIPSITEPEFVAASAVDFLEDTERVLGIVIDGEARAYPIKILNWHEAVNDTVSGKPVLATW